MTDGIITVQFLGTVPRTRDSHDEWFALPEIPSRYIRRSRVYAEVGDCHGDCRVWEASALPDNLVTTEPKWVRQAEIWHRTSGGAFMSLL